MVDDINQPRHLPTYPTLFKAKNIIACFTKSAKKNCLLKKVGEQNYHRDKQPVTLQR